MDTKPDEPVGRAIGAKARSEKLTPEERSSIAKQAAKARWASPTDGETRSAIRVGELSIQEMVIPCAVLEDGTRVLTQRGMFVALGRNKNPSVGHTGTIDNRPGFLAANNLNQFISEDLRRSWSPIPFKLPKGSGGYKGNIAFGYDAKILPMVCHVFTDAERAGKLTKNQIHIAQKCRILEKVLGIVAIIALVDEATGYQDVRDRQALQEILDHFLGKELAKWAKTFPDDFYKEIFRLKGWRFNPGSSKRPRMMAKLTADLVYSRLAPGVLDELRKLSPRSENGNRKNKLFQWLSPDVGHPAIKNHISGVTMLAKTHDDWESFYRAMNRAAQQYGKTLLLPIPDEANDPNEYSPLALQSPPVSPA